MKYVLILCLTIMLGCGGALRTENGKFECYGVFDKDTIEDANFKLQKEPVEYKLVGGNVFWSVILFETGVVPIWLLGFNLYCPVKTGVK